MLGGTPEAPWTDLAAQDTEQKLVSPQLRTFQHSLSVVDIK